MTAPDEQDPLVKAARQHGERQIRWLRDGDPSVAQRLAQIGVLGWMIVVPTLIGVFAGRWLDQKFDSGLFWTAFLSLAAHLTAGVIVGVLYFRSLWWNARRFTAGDRTATTIAVLIGRFVALGVVLTFASLEGALPLLLMALGVFI